MHVSSLLKPTPFQRKLPRSCASNFACKQAALAFSASIVLVLGGCSTTFKVATEIVADKALVALGVRKADPNAPPPPRNTPLRLETAADLNAGGDGRGLATVFRVYKLRDSGAFLATPYHAFGNAEREKAAFGQDLVDVRELILSPGETLDLKETLPAQAPYLATVALYRQPAGQRWRFVYAATDMENTVTTIGLHACAMTSTTTAPLGMTLNESALLSPARCLR